VTPDGRPDVDPVPTDATPVTPSALDETMRDRFAQVAAALVDEDERAFVLLADISNSRFEEARARHPDRIVALGIMEQTVLSAAAGVALEGFVPIVHSIAPFIALRPIEQIRDDFLYQRLGVNILSIGASYDYAEDGYTHHAPDDVPALKGLAGVEIVVPGTPGELEALLRAAFDDGAATYYRLSEQRNHSDRPVRFGELDVIRRAAEAPVVLVVGPLLDRTLEAVGGMDVSIAYATTVTPFDAETLRSLAGARAEVFVVEPWYAGALAADVAAALAPRPVRIGGVGVPRQITTGYGTADDFDRAFGLTAAGIRDRLRAFVERP